jgi:hypothetical protein
MSQFFYKDVNLNQIYYTDGNPSSQFNYIGIPNILSSTNYSVLRPKSFSYFDGPKDLSENCVANTAFYTSSQNVSVPSGCKSINVIIVGGGGGGGGHGGKAGATSGNGTYKSAFGGSGGPGGYGYYYLGNSISVAGTSTIAVHVGTGGDGGSSGNDNSVKSNYNGANVKWNSGTAVGGTGLPGGPGETSYIQTENGAIYSGSGGNGGNGGNGGEAKANQGSTNDSRGNDGSQGESVNWTYGGDINNYPSLSNYGNPGNGAIDGQGQPTGNPGTQGAVQIIWLFD